jgi:RNA-directed DNA polymerase
MGRRRQKSQIELALMVEDKGEARSSSIEGTELPVAKHETESPASGDRLMEEVFQRTNLKKALSRVKENRGSPGVDGMRVSELEDYLKESWSAIREQLLDGTYKPECVRRVEIPKPGGGVRRLGVPTVLDRFIQQAVLQVLQRYLDQTFSDHSYGFRPERSAHQALAEAQRHLTDGYTWVVDIDLEKFFDCVNHDILMSRVARRVGDKRILKLIRSYLDAGVMEDGLVSGTEEGTPQGGPLSPFLSNIVLDDLDRELERRGHRFVRYADDCNIYVRSERAGQRVMESISRFITKKLKLRVNRKKSAVGRPWERKFLGFRFVKREGWKRSIAPESISRFKRRVREITCRSRGVSLGVVVRELARYLIGWRSYFGYCETPSVLVKLDSWIRRRLRSFVWKKWKRGRRRFAQLRALAVGKDLAAQTAGSQHGPWRISRSPALSYALPSAYFEKLGLPRLAVTK